MFGYVTAFVVFSIRLARPDIYTLSLHDALPISTQSLAPNEGLTLSVTFPKGIVSEPATAQRFIWFLQDNRAQLFLVIGLIAVFAYYWYQWQRKGRGPEPGPVFPRDRKSTRLNSSHVA